MKRSCLKNLKSKKKKKKKKIKKKKKKKKKKKTNDAYILTVKYIQNTNKSTKPEVVSNQFRTTQQKQYYLKI